MLKVLHTKYLLLIAIFLSCGLVQAATATPDTIAPTRVRVNELNPAPGAGYVPQSVYNGRAHWAQQVRVLTTPQPVPTLPPVLNATKSAVFSDVAGDTWYIDWMGRAHKLTVNPATLRDHDWYELPGFVPPDNIGDFAWRTGNAAIGGQLNPGLDIELTVVDSSSFSAGGGGRGQFLLKGAVKTTFGFEDYGSGRWNSIDASWGNMYLYTPAATPGIFVFLEGTGSSTIPISGTPHFVINAASDYVQMNDYPNTRDDAGAPVNVLTTALNGIVESHPIADVYTSIKDSIEANHPEICDELATIPPGAYTSGAKAVFSGGVATPPTWVGFDFDIPAQFPGSTSATDCYLHIADGFWGLTYYPPATTNPTTPVVCTNVSAIQAFINSILTGNGWAANDIIYQVNPDNTISVWYNPAFNPADFFFWMGPGTPDNYSGKEYPQIPTAYPASGGGCFTASFSGSVAAAMREEIFTPTTGQTTFTIAYTAPAPGGTNVPVRVYRNGVRLTYTAAAPGIRQFTYTGSTITTASNLAGDEIAVEYFN